MKRASLATVIAAAALLAAGAAQAEVVLRLAENQPDDNPVTIAMREFAKLVDEKTKGGVKVEVYAGAQLGQEPETIEQTQAGIIDLARVNSVVLANVSPSMGVFTLPYVFRDAEHKYKVLDGEVGKEVTADLEKVGLVGFPYMEAGTRNFYTRAGKPVKSLEDLKGLKIRVQPARISTRMVELLGATPTPMNYGEVFSALQTGVIDGAENDYVSYVTSSHYEAAPNLIEDGHLSPPAILVMNKQKFDSLSEEHRKAIVEAADEAAKFERKAMFAANEEAKKKVEAAGVTIVSVDNEPFRKAVEPIYDEFPALKPFIARIQAVD
ncbi:tripartite ATP-independent transporter DctP family solute receptor [Chelatococcus caeni]|uniref:Tripartite ATP-independent transporter DctP family solute receptor n=1 Tax=Chelatococcus caeni TaxID=1348468 RepID=A0A840C2Y3_9HYPH|nr:TRAP transporter substrate-binding protein [Chelatococcus caeni]MBB4019510.1 tripartite ATP-independent transporter DctP family solute receptor [Chelatococcus caeni]